MKLVIPGNHIFKVDTTVTDATGLQLRGPITIEGEDKLNSKIKLVENTQEANSAGDIFTGQSSQVHLFDAQSAVAGQRLAGIVLRNFTMIGSYLGSTSTDPLPPKDQLHGTASLFHFKDIDDVRFEDLVFTNSRAVIVGGDGVRGLSMRGCLMSESQRGGMVISGAADVTVENNDFQWIPDDPVAINASGPAAVGAWFYRYGGSIRIVGNRCFGCRGLNVVGAKNVLIESNVSVLGRGRAIHVGTVTGQDKGDTTTLNIAVRNNLIIDLLSADVDPRFDGGGGGHRAIDIELFYAAPGPLAAIPGLPTPGTGAFVDPTAYHYTVGQGTQGRAVWAAGQTYQAGDEPANGTWWLGRLYQARNSGFTTGNPPPTHVTPPYPDTPDNNGNGVLWHFLSQQPTPSSANILIEGNIIGRTRPPAVALDRPDHVANFDSFERYNLGKYGGDKIGYSLVRVNLDQITPDEGIAISGWARGLVIRGNQIGNCVTGISFQGRSLDLPFTLRDVVIVDNDFFDWSKAAILFFNYTAGQRQRVSIIGNCGDGDPYFVKPGIHKKLDGTWPNDSNDCAFIETSGVSFLTIAANHVRNVNRLVSGLNDASHAMQDNVAYCFPTAVGWNAGNAGIGTPIHPARGWRYVIEDCAPTSTTYGKVLNTCPLALKLDTGRTTPPTPTGGKWIEGTIVANLAPASSGGTAPYIVSGWQRVSTGPGDAMTTDWWELRTSIKP